MQQLKLLISSLLFFLWFTPSVLAECTLVKTINNGEGRIDFIGDCGPSRLPSILPESVDTNSQGWDQQRELSVNHYRGPQLSSTEQQILRESIAGLFRNPTARSPEQQREVDEQRQTAARFDRNRQAAQQMHAELSNYSRQVNAYLQNSHAMMERSLELSRQAQQLALSRMPEMQKQAMLGLLQVKLDRQVYPENLSTEFNLVRSKYWAVSAQDLKFEQSYAYLHMGSRAYRDASELVKEDKTEESRFFLELSNTLLDIALGSVPFVGMYKDAYEAYSGKHLISGETITTLERSIAATSFVVGLYSGGMVSSASLKRVAALMPYASEAMDGARWFVGWATELGLKAKDDLGHFLDLSRRILGNESSSIVDVEQFFKGELTRFTPLRHGPLHGITLGTGTVADTFRSSSYFGTVLADPVKLYRAFDIDTQQFGKYWSRVKPSGPFQVTIDSALDPSWGNKATHWVEITVPSGEQIFEGIASEVLLRSNGAQATLGQLLGGGSQVYITKPKIPAHWTTGMGEI